MVFIKQVIFLIIITFSFVNAQAQKFTERIYLKDSSYYEGYIIEQVPTQYLKINRIAQKDTITVPFPQIWKLTKTYEQRSDSLSVPEKKVLKKRYLKTAYFELLGNAGLYSFNFDMRTQKGIRDKWGFRIGLEKLGINLKDSSTNFSFKANLLAVPFGINYLVGKKKGALELGMGATYFFLYYGGQYVISQSGETETLLTKIFKNEYNSLIGTFNIGYRHSPYKNGLTYRIMFAPLVVEGSLFGFMGLSLGYKFI